MGFLEKKHIERKIGFKVMCTGEGFLSEEAFSCGSILLLQIKDVINFSYQNSNGEKKYDYCFVCPICNTKTRIDNSKISYQNPIAVN